MHEEVAVLLGKNRIMFLLLVIILLMSGCGSRIDNNGSHGGSSGIDNNGNGGSGGNIDGVTPSPKPDPVREQVNGMTLDEKIGQLVMTGVDGYVSDEHSEQLISQYHVGGFVILGQNVKNTDQVLELINSLKAANTGAGNRVPLFIGVDQEGGRVSRMPGEFVRIPAAKTIGAADSEDFSYKVGSLLAQEVKAFGYNVDFAPVLDINSNPKNPVIGDRALSSKPEVVSRLGVETMKGIRSQNIIPVVKHFPGHGDTSVDSHTGLPVLDFDMERLRSFELLPFAEAIKNDADAVMVAHILFPKIDSQYPASMSESIITGILKKELSFKGLVLTDDMAMGAIAKNYDAGAAAVRSVNAGADIVLVCHDFDREKAVIEALKKAAESGEIKSERLDDSVYKILQLKQKYRITDEKVPSVDVKGINDQIRAVLDSRAKK